MIEGSGMEPPGGPKTYGSYGPDSDSGPQHCLVGPIAIDTSICNNTIVVVGQIP